MKHVITILAVMVLSAIWVCIISAFHLLLNTEMALIFATSSVMMLVVNYFFSEEMAL